MMMQFVCTARSADDEDYRPLAETPLTLDFAYDHCSFAKKQKTD